MRFRPSYIKLYETGELSKRISTLNEILKSCVLCPRRCRVDRVNGARGVCNAAKLPFIASVMPHFGEEPPLVGHGGSGAIFMAGCNLKCVFCQNSDISHGCDGEEISSDELSAIMVNLQRKGCHNINFVTPTHQIAQIVESLPKAIENGLDVPLVYNCGGYEEANIIKLLEGIFDIYMPDIKYSDPTIALNLSLAPDYVKCVQSSVKEMHRQVGDLVIDKNGIAQKGLIVRHLVLPEGLAGTTEVMRFIAKEISADTYVNIMDQYRPCFKAFMDERITREITRQEYEDALAIAREEGLRNIEGA